MEWSEYQEANPPKGRMSKKKIDKHYKGLFVSWFNLYRRPGLKLIKDAENILNGKS
jgi:hypothetical protein